MNDCEKESFSFDTMVTTIKIIMCILFSLSHTASTTVSEPINFHYLPGVMKETYSKMEDINIGAVMVVKMASDTDPAGSCSPTSYDLPGAIDITEAVAFAVDLVNQSPDLLPNVKLGYVVRGSCYSNGVSLGTSLSFMPRTERVCNDSVCHTQPSTSSDPRWLSHDVIGVLPPAMSSYTIPVSSLYGVARLPMMGYIVTSDDLSNKANHPYFFRICPPDRYQVDAILRFIAENGWSYISILYQDDSYGNRAYSNMEINAGRYGICIATSHRLLTSTDYEEVVDDLITHSRARVVVVFTINTSFKVILQNVINNKALGHFIWIGGDYLYRYTGYQYQGVTEEPAVGTFLFDLYSTHVSAFYDYLRKLRVSTSNNPWMKDVWEIIFECSFEKGTCDFEKNIMQSRSYQPRKDTALIIDAVFTFAHAAHNLLSERCPEARGQDARACITGELLLGYLKDTKFDGFAGRVEFDENQDVKGKYIISQLVHDYYKNPFLPDAEFSKKKRLFWKRVGLFDMSTDTISYFNESISWSHLKVLGRIVPWTADLAPIEIPESVCSRPCLVGEYKIEKKLSCCWECRTCRENEYLVDGNTSCHVCPSFTWPDPTTSFTSCIDIPLTYPAIDDTIPIVLISLAIFALGIALSVSIIYAVYRNERVIKASSKELSAIQLVAIFAGYTNIILFQTAPSENICSAIFFLFCMSFVLLYSPLLVKTIRIFRIFRGGTKNQKPRFISPRSQLIFATTLIAVQIILCVTTYIFFTPGSKRTQPIWSEKMVELSCDLTFPGLVSFLGYNIVLVSLCSVFAFMVRKLPDNFNESKFISMCVSTTLLIWLAFIPTYFTADREYVRVFLLSMALLLNHSVALIFLFVPKIYAAVFVPSESGNFSRNRS